MKKIGAFIISLLCILSLASCKASIESINIDESSIPSTINASELDSKLALIKLNVVDSKGNTETIGIDSSMISTEDYNSLKSYGKHTVTINYEGFTTNLTLNIVTNNYVVNHGMSELSKTVKNFLFIPPCSINKNTMNPLRLYGQPKFIHV